MGACLTVLFPYVAVWLVTYLFGESTGDVKIPSKSAELLDSTYWTMFYLFITLLFLSYFLRKYTSKYYKTVWVICLLPLLLYVWMIIDTFSPLRLSVGINLSVLNGDSVRVDRLLNLGANPDKVFSQDGINPNEHTPLIVAAGKNDIKIVEILLKHGADMSIKNKAGETAKSLAQSKNFTEVVKTLESHELQAK